MSPDIDSDDRDEYDRTYPPGSVWRPREQNPAPTSWGLPVRHRLSRARIALLLLGALLVAPGAAALLDSLS